MIEIDDTPADPIEAYVVQALKGFLLDPPDTDFQRGYMDGLRTLYIEAFGHARTSALVRAIDELR